MIATRKNLRDLHRFLTGLRVLLMALAVAGMVLTTVVADLLWRRAVVDQAQTDLRRMAVLMAARMAEDVHELGQQKALLRLRETLAMPTGGMGFHLALVSADGRVLAATTGAPVEESDLWPASASMRGRPYREVDLAGERCLAASVRVRGTKWALVVIQPRASLLPDRTASHWLLVLTAALIVVTASVVLHNVALRVRAEEAAREAEKVAEGLVDAMDGVAAAGIISAESGQILKANQGLA
ncbi:MAG: hypothetical protein N2512_12570, partial [Armatimonadetes bacterium]|nr:hypothetical protein [Armatimonadota bacterium]